MKNIFLYSENLYSFNFKRYLKIEKELTHNPFSLYLIKNDILSYLGFDSNNYYIGTITDSSISIEHKYKEHILIYLFFNSCDEDININIRIDKRDSDKDNLKKIEKEMNELIYKLKDQFKPFKDLDTEIEESINYSTWNNGFRLFIDNNFKVFKSSFIQIDLMRLYFKQYFSMEVDDITLELIAKNNIITIKEDILTIKDDLIKEIFKNNNKKNLLNNLNETLKLNYQV